MDEYNVSDRMEYLLVRTRKVNDFFNDMFSNITIDGVGNMDDFVDHLRAFSEFSGVLKMFTMSPITTVSVNAYEECLQEIELVMMNSSYGL